VKKILCIAATMLVTRAASAQTFPADDRWAPLPCGGGVMTDGHRDQSSALRERDIVGDALGAAGYRASDDKFVYLRLRLDDNPAPGGVLRPFAWGFELDLNGDRSNYEILISVAGSTKNIAVHRNTTTTLPNDPNDPADEPAVGTFPFATHGRAVVAQSSTYGGDADYFLDIAVPWSTLEPLGLTRTTPLVVWAATSSNASSLNGDFACHDGASGPPKLSAIAPPPTTLDPGVDSDGDGFSDAVEVSSGTDPKNPASKPAGVAPPLGGATDPVLAGAGGCSYAVSSDGSWLAVLLALTAASRSGARRGWRRETTSRHR
jgi:hypothetical protein